MIGPSALERRYRRLLVWYPAEHRRAYGEEMIGVLLASAPDDRRRPGPAGAFDLIRGGLRVRYQSARRRLTDVSWPDALAVCTVAIPVMLIGCFLAEWVYYLHLYVGAWDVQVEMGLVVVAVAAPSLIALRFRRTGALVAAGIALVAAASMAGSVIHTWDWAVYGETITACLALVVLAAALWLSPGPRRSADLLTPGAWLVLAGSGAAEGLMHAYLYRLPSLIAAAAVLALLAVFVIGLARTVPGRALRGALALLAVPAYPGAVWAIGLSGSFVTGATRFPNVVFLPTALFAVLAATAVVRWRATWADRGRQ